MFADTEPHALSQTFRSMPVKGVAMPDRTVCKEQFSAFNTMVSHISHDLRHPLTLILANAEFLTSSGTELERNDSYLEIRWAVDRMTDLIGSLLDLSKTRESLRLGRRSIIDTVEHAIRLANARQALRCIPIGYEHRGDSMGWFDPYRLERAIANLVLNACEAVSPNSGQVQVSTTVTCGTLKLEVWDNGPGIPISIRDSMFQPFVSSGKKEGSGLGLAIAKKIIDEHRGEIGLDESYRKGTLFRVTIPFADPLGASNEALPAGDCAMR
jgi:signal transduction histidine kinase